MGSGLAGVVPVKLRILFCLHHWIFQLPWGQLPHPVVTLTQLYETGSVPNPDQCLLSSTPRVLRSAVLLLVLDSRLESTLNVVKYLSTQVFEISLDGRRDRGLLHARDPYCMQHSKRWAA